MTGNSAKIHTSGKKSPVEVRRKTAEIIDFRRIGVFVGLHGKRIGHVDVWRP